MYVAPLVVSDKGRPHDMVEGINGIVAIPDNKLARVGTTGQVVRIRQVYNSSWPFNGRINGGVDFFLRREVGRGWTRYLHICT